MELRRHVGLTARERGVALLLLEALSLKEIAERACISEETVRMHVEHTHAKTDTKNLQGLALWAVAHRACCVGDDLSAK